MTEPPKADLEAAVEFLKRWAPAGPWVLTAIDVEGKGIETATFDPASETYCLGWLAKHRDRNLYFHVNRPTRKLTKKAGLKDIKSVDWFHIDIDPRAGENLDDERKRALALLTTNLPEGVPAPNAIIFSGGGYQAFWRLEEPIQIDGDLVKAEDAKRWNQWLEVRFEADNCHNIDRIMRLPGTINWPNKIKRDKGRVATLAKLIKFDGAPFTLSAFKQVDIVEPSGDMDGPLEVSELSRCAVPERVAKIIRDGDGDIDKGDDNSRSAWLFDVVCQLVRCSVPDEAIFSIITDPDLGVSKSVLDKKGAAVKYAHKQIKAAREAVAGSPILLSKGVPMHNARQFVRVNMPTLMRWNDDYLVHSGTVYRDLDDDTARAKMWLFMERAIQTGKKKDDPEFMPFCPSRTDVSDALDALRGVSHVARDAINPPCWLDKRADPNPREVLACRNGLLHLPTMELLPGDPQFLTRNALDFDYDADPAAPVQWLAFLTDLFGSDEDQVKLLQEIMGYFLLPDTSQQKLFYIKGPTRSGKGTINRIAIQLVGERNCTSPSLSDLEGFGLSELIGKQLATISDMRIGRFTNLAEVTSNLLKITGEDPITAPRKFKNAWNGVLGTRFLILSNDDVHIKDTSGALANRFVGILLTESFLGKEDRHLTRKLGTELPGILLWAIEGWRRLNEQGHFTVTAQSKSIVRAVHAGSDKVAAFFYDRCALDPAASTTKSEMFKAYLAWAEVEFPNDRRIGDKVFGREFLACAGGKVAIARPRIDGKRAWVYAGIKLLTGDEADAREDASAIAQRELMI